jgi:hypothetical protein
LTDQALNRWLSWFGLSSRDLVGSRVGTPQLCAAVIRLQSRLAGIVREWNGRELVSELRWWRRNVLLVAAAETGVALAPLNPTGASFSELAGRGGVAPKSNSHSLFRASSSIL